MNHKQNIRTPPPPREDTCYAHIWSEGTLSDMCFTAKQVKRNLSFYFSDFRGR